MAPVASWWSMAGVGADIVVVVYGGVGGRSIESTDREGLGASSYCEKASTLR